MNAKKGLLFKGFKMLGKKKITTLVDQLKHAGAKKNWGVDIAKELLLEGVREVSKRQL